MKHARILAAILCCTILISPVGSASAQSSAAQDRATRADLAATYLEFEEAFAAASLTGEAQRYVHNAFDYAAAMFFGGRLSEAVGKINELTWFVSGGGASARSAPPADEQLFRSLRVHFSPAVYLTAQTDRPRAVVRSTAPITEQDGKHVALTLQLTRACATEPVWHRALTVAVENSSVRHVIELDDLPEELPSGTYTATLVDEAGRVRAAGRLMVLEKPFEEIQTALQTQFDQAIAAAHEPSAELQRAMTICRARLRVLTTRPAATNSIEFLLDPFEHAAKLATEIEAIAAGRNPYRRLSGEHWRVTERAGGESPLMVYAPRRVNDQETPLPLVIALHGAGGDETMFMRAYGAGMIRDLAESRGFIAVSPLTYHVMAERALLDRIIADLSEDYAIDPTGIFLVGHSLGGMTTSSLIGTRQNDSPAIAAACCIAGAGTFMQREGETHPPVLIIGAEFDSMIPAERLKRIAEVAVGRGLPVAYRHATNQGHVLVVNETLAEAIDWLLTHTASQR